MFRYIFLFVLAFNANAFQTKQEIIEQCKRLYLHDYGNWMVLECAKKEIKTQNEIEELAKS